MIWTSNFLHSDYGSLTVLIQKDIGGLEILSNSSFWIPAPVIPNHVLINIGDLLEFWTKGLFKSTVHRVVARNNKTSGDKNFAPDNDRYSIAYFCHAEDDVGLDPIPSKIIDVLDENTKVWDKVGYKEGAKGKVITSGEHLRYRLDVSYKYC
ncbi:2495_t:CDS:2 [Acaulospora morrowiae]|uniref:2495_t:CDS:1 n=1 Tax=Acaulospora morrowiae TaxID=94023 RepID=A0A9N8ZUB1_9GLOM|nr:2495_t:CDS:2 [Acaulospora morrowiae]